MGLDYKELQDLYQKKWRGNSPERANITRKRLEWCGHGRKENYFPVVKVGWIIECWSPSQGERKVTNAYLGYRMIHAIIKWSLYLSDICRYHLLKYSTCGAVLGYFKGRCFFSNCCMKFQYTITRRRERYSDRKSVLRRWAVSIRGV